MRLVVDSNVLIAALLRNSAARRVLAWPLHRFYSPEHALAEVERHMEEFAARMEVTVEEAHALLLLVAGSVETVPEEVIRPCLAEARAIMDPLDPDDAVFLATALAIPCDGIWSHDRAFRRQGRVRTFATHELLKDLESQAAALEGTAERLDG